jgi:hypothetical protein
MPVVRHRRGGRGDALHIRVPELEDPQHFPLRLRRSPHGGNRHDGELRARRPEVPGPERRAELHVQRSDLVPVSCKNQEEVDHFWNNLSDGGEEGPCGWIKDRFGVSWQIVPTALPELLGDPDPEKSRRVMEAMLQMKKLEIDVLERAAEAA